ncbi:methyltransferase domain-containing protein [Pseudomonas sp. GD03721]|nr:MULTISPECIES: methyltransferase domain-containing protein [unclassified Pseudomonas]MDH1443985.1 methyltransferase domain-containing protein [Pseudomonas sp. GD03722]WGG03276.1 methyltransferase domain-containing protein [Pseudomonas sp. GD03721]WGG07444.1 methyltransferase domain-containing protein [Pseudomonas sp. GD03919]
MSTPLTQQDGQLFDAARQAHAAGNLAQAQCLYRTLLERYPQQAEVHLALGNLLLDSLQEHAARPHLEYALHALPEDVNVRFCWAQLLSREGAFDEAQPYLLAVLADQPTHLGARLSLATQSMYRGQLDEAYHWLGSLATYHPNGDAQIICSQLELLSGKRQDAQPFFCAKARVFSRSSTQAGGPPGERELLELNPDRHAGILNITGWPTLYAGTLNLQIRFNFEEVAKNIAPLFYENGSDVIYPQEYAHIPALRIGYWYYQGYVQFKGKRSAVLFRRAVTPNAQDVVEVIAAQSLRETLELSDAQELLCYFGTPASEADQADDWLACKLDIHEIFLEKGQAFGRHQALYQGHEGWNLPGQRPTLQRMRHYALERWLDDDQRVLDIGCNIGCFGLEVSRHVRQYVGFDINESLIHIAQRLARHHGVDNCEFRVSAFDDFASRETQTFDLIFSFAVHVWIGRPMPEYVKQLRSLLNPGGRIIIESNDLVRNDEQFFANLASFYEAGFALLHQGQLMDDGVIKRGFCVFQDIA